MKPSSPRDARHHSSNQCCLTALLLLLSLSACHPAPPPPATQRAPVIIEPMADVVRQINSNSEQIPTLWARQDYEANVVDDKGQKHFINGDGVVLYRRPLGLRMLFNKPVAGTVLEIGSTPERYWLKLILEANTMWWGNYSNLGKPCVQPIPIQPDMILEVLGVSTFNTDFVATPAPVMRFNPDRYADAYMFDWIVPASNPARFVVQKEIWYDRATKRPVRVILFDSNGQPVLMAILSHHRQIPVEDLPEAQWPWVATSYRLSFPQNGSNMRFGLSDMVLCKNGVPCRRGIVFPGNTPADAGVAKVIQLDAGCGDAR